MSILKLDDLIKDDIELELNGKLYHFDLSFKAMVAFKKWTETNDIEKELTDTAAIQSLLDIMIKESDDFNKALESLSIQNQTRIITTITNKWISEMVPEQPNGKDKTKK